MVKRLLNGNKMVISKWLNIGLLLLIIFSACNTDKKKRWLAGKSYKLWQKVDFEEQSRGVKTFYYFDIDGKWKYYRSYQNSKIEELDMGDVIPIEKWEFLKDKDQVKIGGMVYDINKLSDTVFVYSIYTPKFSHKVELIYRGDRLE